MMSNNKPCEMLTIQSLLSNDQYLIPMYQRNFAWEESHLSQLIQDIWDYHLSEKNYYIGTLVVYNRKDGIYETVDGQQRLTTLNIILCALRNEFDRGDIDLAWFKRVNISYEFRERSTQTLLALFNHSNDEELHDIAISNMYDNVRRTIDNIVPKDELHVFLKYFFEKVIITRVILPIDTDLNHYFEIMNSRGEQLEKHEILKALIMRQSSNNPKKNWMIGQIWEACADMDRYVPLNFTKEQRDIIFGLQWNEFNWNSLDCMVERINNTQNDVKNEQFSITDVISKNDAIYVKEPENEGDRFESIIKFPGFLLQVLRVLKEDDVPLDDKRLLTTFNNYLKEEDFADLFILKMLELRFLYDKFVIKRDFKDDSINGNMNLLSLTKQKDGFSYNNTFADNEGNRQVIMIESMFHVSLPSQNYKHWLCAVLNYINKNKEGQGLALYLEDLAKTYMFGRFISGKPSNDGFYYKAIFKQEEIVLQQPNTVSFPSFTEHIDFFVFNYIDYCLWKEHKADYSDFKFTSRNSVEHFYPQHPMFGYPSMDEKYLHDIGNLCLISASKNSELKNYSPTAKTEHYMKVGEDSLKQKIMMRTVNENKSMSSDIQKIWWNNEIEEHHKFIEKLLLSSFTKLGNSQPT